MQVQAEARRERPEEVGAEAIGLEEWAFLLAGVREECRSEEVLSLAKLVSESERLQGYQRRLEQMAVDAGDERVAAGWPRDVVLEHRALDLLLAAEWEDPAEILHPESWQETDYRPLIRISSARRLRGEGDAAGLASVEARLRAALNGGAEG